MTPLDQGTFRLPDTPPMSNTSVEKRVAPIEEESLPKRTKQSSSPPPGEKEKERKGKEKRPAPKPPSEIDADRKNKNNNIPLDVPKTDPTPEMEIQQPPETSKQEDRVPVISNAKHVAKNIENHEKEPNSRSSPVSEASVDPHQEFNHSHKSKESPKADATKHREHRDISEKKSRRASNENKAEKIKSSAIDDHVSLSSQNQSKINNHTSASKDEERPRSPRRNGSSNASPLPSDAVDYRSSGHEIMDNFVADAPTSSYSSERHQKIRVRSKHEESSSIEVSNSTNRLSPDKTFVDVSVTNVKLDGESGGRKKKSKGRGAEKRTNLNDSVTVVPVSGSEPVSVVSVNSEEITLSSSESGSATVVTVNSCPNSSQFDVSITPTSDQVL